MALGKKILMREIAVAGASRNSASSSGNGLRQLDQLKTAVTLRFTTDASSMCQRRSLFIRSGELSGLRGLRNT